MYDENSEEIKQQKMGELKQKLLAQKKVEEQQIAAEMQLSSLAKHLCEEKSYERLNNVKLVNKELYLKVMQAVVYLGRQGQLQGKINEEQMKQLLEKLSSKREIKIKRK